MPTPYLHRELLLGLTGDRDPEVPGGEGGGDEGEAAFCRLQPGAGGLGRLHIPVDRGDVDGLSVSGGDQAQAHGGDGRHSGARLQVV